jgi:hypothetical protein
MNFWRAGSALAWNLEHGAGEGVMMEEGVTRAREPNRKQLILPPADRDGLSEPGHPARAIWRVLEGQELWRFYEPIKREAIARWQPTRRCFWRCGRYPAGHRHES